MLPTQAAIETLAGRIERAYRLRKSSWYRGCSTSRVWASAAAILVQLHQDDPTLPLDPELYVAVQPASETFNDDPWITLTQPSSARHFRAGVRTMISRLRAELKAEIRSAERRLGRGESIDEVLKTPGKRLSSMGCYMVAIKAGRADLAENFRAGAIELHRSCPLYRTSSLQLLPPGFYPVRERSTDEELVALTRQHSHQTLLN